MVLSTGTPMNLRQIANRQHLELHRLVSTTGTMLGTQVMNRVRQIAPVAAGVGFWTYESKMRLLGSIRQVSREIETALKQELQHSILDAYVLGQAAANEYELGFVFSTEVEPDQEMWTRQQLWHDALGKYCAFSMSHMEQVAHQIELHALSTVEQLPAQMLEACEPESYRLTRVIQTELSEAYHRGLWKAGLQMNQHEPMWKLLVSAENAVSSRAPMDEAFIAGKFTGQYPPLHPNSTSTMLLWRESWTTEAPRVRTQVPDLEVS